MVRFRRDVAEGYELLTPAEKQSILNHVENHDYPFDYELLAGWATAAAPAGAGGAAPFAAGPKVLFEKKFFKSCVLEAAAAS
jgi:hypothetical protein